MMKKWFVLLAILSMFLISACSNEDDELSGKTFELSYPPVEEEDLDNPSKYNSIVTLEFSKDNTVSDPVNDTKGTYKLNEDSLEVNFEDEDEKLTVNFNDLKKSDKDFSLYSAVIESSELKVEESNKAKKLVKLSSELSENQPVELIEK